MSGKGHTIRQASRATALRVEGDKDHNIAPDFIANLDEKCEGKAIKVAETYGAFGVTNTRKSF